MKIVNLHSILVTLSLGFLLVTSRVKQCGKQGGGARCPEGQCCSNFGWCGTTYPYCAPENCQSQCPTPSPPPVPPPPPPPPPFNPPPPPSPPPPPPFNPPPPPPPVLPPPSFNPPPPPPPVLPPPSFNPPPPPPPVLPPPSFNPPPPPPPPPPPSFTPPPPVSPHDISNIITESLFEEMLPYRNDPRCPAEGFYTYDSFISSARNFPAFGTTGSIETRKREIAAFLAQTSHETTGGWPDAPGGPYSWGYCFIEEVNADGDYCVPSDEWTCVPGEKYFGRGPIQLSYNYNYGPAGQALGLDLLSNPDLVATDSTVSFETAFWFWMTAQYSKPSCHDVITETWEPSPADIEANRLPGFGVTTNIINGGLECGHGPDDRVADRIGFFKRYCDLLGISPGDNLDCYDQSSFGVTLTNPRFYGLLKMPVDQA